MVEWILFGVVTGILLTAAYRLGNDGHLYTSLNLGLVWVVYWITVARFPGFF